MVAIGLAMTLVPVPAAAAPEDGGPGFAGWSGDAETSRPASTARQPVGALPGIDVSHHQDVIDWAQVAASGQRFAIAKATEGTSFVDPMYATNKAGAEANGIAFGAYHFARPDATPNDAQLEADHFVDTALLQPGNLIPVLDIERTGGLSQAEITTWILDWLARVTVRLGVRPMVYTSPNGWDTRTGDTTAVADAGYTVLWVAHWDVAEPRLPANEWSGNGWTFWQYDNCGSIPGIQGCVDRDWFDGATFDAVSIPSPDATPPLATITPPSGVSGPVSIAFNEVVRGITPSNTFVRIPSTGATVAAEIACRSGRGNAVDCLAGNVRTVAVQPLEGLLPGEAYEAVVNPAGSLELVVDRSGNPAPASAQAFAPPTVLDERSDALAYGWRTASNRRAYGRSFAVEAAAGASASFAFTGRSVTWYTATGPSMGRASVLVDGRRIGAFDQYAPSPAFKVARSITKLPRGEHVLTIRVLGTSSPGATDTQVVVDAFRVGGDVVANPEVEVAWGTVRAPGASGGSVATSGQARASTELTFSGTGVEWTTVRGHDQGRAAIYVDGSLVRTVDNFARDRTFGVVRSVTGLSDGVHTLRIVVLGEARAAATGTFVSVDGFSVLG